MIDAREERDVIRTEETQFFSDGLKLGATIYWPDDPGATAPQPMVVACSGFTGLRHIHPARFARSFTTQGLPCFAFDYRGFADSEGPRCRVLLEEQVRDIMHGTAFISSDARVDSSRIILLGWGMGAGLVIDAARALPGIIGIAALNGFYNGARVQRAHRGDDGYQRFCERVDEERRERSRTGIAAEADPFDIYPLDAQSRRYVDDVLRATEAYQAERYSFELADSLLRWDVEAHAATMRIPILIFHGDRNALHPVGEAESLHRVYGGPKELNWIDDAGHTEFMHDDDPKYKVLAGRTAAWINARLAEASGS